jgi:hypothetical protein
MDDVDFTCALIFFLQKEGSAILVNVCANDPQETSKTSAIKNLVIYN